MHRGFASNIWLKLAAGAVFLAFAAVGTKLVHLHVVQRDAMQQYLTRARRSIIVENGRRGDILDARGNTLATSVTLIDVGMDPQMLRREDQGRLPDLAKLLNVPFADICNAAAKQIPEAVAAEKRDELRPVQWVKLAEGVDEATYDKVKELKIKGVYGSRTYRRSYPNKTLAAHVVGFVNKEDIPAAGVERYMDFYLRGHNGWCESEKDGRRQELAQFRSREVPASDGYSVSLTLDMVVQHMIEEELQVIADKFKPAKATIIVSDPQTGFILGLGNYPSFNLSEFNKAPIASLRNIAVADQFEPGSTFKIVAVSAGLNEGIISPSSMFDCGQPTTEYRGRMVKMPKDDHKSGLMSVAEIVSRSSNRGAGLIAMKMGDQRFYDYAKAFGFGQATGFPFGGEIDGTLTPPKQWDGLTISRMPMGHSIDATPMQVHYAMATIANGGLLMTPQIIRQVRDPQGEVYRTYEPVVRSRAISPRCAETMARLLMGVASPEGTASNAAIPNFQIAGKTGTTQKLVDGRYSERRHVGSFVGFFPASRPRVVITVIVDDAVVPKELGGLGYGRVVAVPSFKHLAEQLIQYLDIKPVIDPSRGMLAMEGGRR